MLDKIKGIALPGLLLGRDCCLAKGRATDQMLCGGTWTKCFRADFTQAAFWLSAGLRRAAILRLLMPKLIIVVNSGKLFEFNLALLLNNLGKKVKDAENVRNVRLG